MTRRELLQVPAAAAASAALNSAIAATPYSMPGLFPGRVVGVKHSGATTSSMYYSGYQADPIRAIVRKGIMELTGQSSLAAAWRKLFQPGDVVGIKVSPGVHSSVISSQYCLMEIVSGLLLAGVAPASIVVMERYSYLLNLIHGWFPAWLRTAYATPGYYTDDQTSIVGYDSNYYIDLPQYLKSWQSATNPAHTRSYVAKFVTQQVSKIILLAPMKEHQAAGVTLCLKNATAGFVNNWNRFHDAVDASGQISNHLVDAIPATVALPVIRNKVVLGIIDGVHGLCAGGPINYADPQYGFVWPHDTMYFATDVVAADRVGWKAIDEERVRRGMLPVEFAPKDAWDNYDHRQPQHISMAGQMGLGEWRDSNIDLRSFTIG